jgi:hypothetical protein
MSMLRWLLLALPFALATIAEGDVVRRRALLAAAALLLAAAATVAWRDGWLRGIAGRAATAFALCIGAVALPLAVLGGGDLAYRLTPGLVAVLIGWSVVLALPLARGAEGAAVVERIESALAGRWVAAAAMAMTIAMLVVAHEHLVGGYRFSTVDETFYLVQSGWMSLPGFGMHVDRDLRPFFATTFCFFAGDRLVTQYPPGWPVALALFSRLGLGEWSGAILGGCSAALTFAIGRRVHGPLAAAIAVALLASHTWFRETHVGFLAHPLAGAALLAAAWLVIDRERWSVPQRALATTAAGALLGVAIAARPLTGATVALSIELWRAMRSREPRRGIWRTWPWYVAGGLPVVALLLAYNAATTGSPLVFGYTATHGTLHDLGFGVRGYLTASGVRVVSDFTLAAAAGNLAARVADFVQDGLGLVLLVPALVVASAHGWRPRAATIAAFLALPVAHFFYFHTHWRLYVELLPFLLIGVGGAIAAVVRERPRGGLALAGAALIATIAFGPSTALARYRVDDAVDTAIRELERVGRGRRMIALLPGVRADSGRAFPVFVLNRSGTRGEVLVVPDGAGDLTPLRARFPDREWLRLEWTDGGRRLAVRPAYPPVIH